MRTTTEIQRWLIEKGYLAPFDENGKPNDDGKFGTITLAAYNRARAAKGEPPHQGPLLLTEINRDLFPEEQPTPKPPKPNPLKNWLIGLAIKQAASYLKGTPIMNFLAGYKTYLVAAVLLAIGALGVVGIPIPGFEGDPGYAFATAIGLITGRAGAKSDVNKALGK